jgi:hypothetical protein
MPASNRKVWIGVLAVSGVIGYASGGPPRLPRGGSGALVAAEPDAPAPPDTEAGQRRACRYLPLLREARIHRELRLTGPQIDQLNQLDRQQMSKQLALLTAPGETRQAKETEGQAQVEQLRAETAAAKLKVLDAQQAARYRQLALQAAGIRLFKEVDVVATLKITDEQKKRLASAEQAYDQETKELLDACRDKTIHPRLYPEKLGELTKQCKRNLEAVLSDEQKACLRQMQGEPFDFGTALKGSR